MKREAVIADLASEGLELILGSAEAGSSTVPGPTPTDPVELRKCARDLKALTAVKEHFGIFFSCIFFFWGLVLADWCPPLL